MQQRFITNTEMDSIASSVLREAKIPTAWQGYVNRVDIDTIIEFEYGLEIEWENIDHFSEDGVVLAAIFPRRKIIVLNESQRELFMMKMGTMNFSKAHELGHWILHVTDQQDYNQLSFEENDIFNCRNCTKKHWRETQADMFAAALLMPKDIVCGAVNRLKERGNVVFLDLYRLARGFEVSITALTTRVQELNLLYIDNKKIYNTLVFV